ncbi:TrmH family RNA methyltransferase [Sungkyunkwania multivorans]|uniref:TrmH family RNA methyltransferase n=1 Tax=Sungkyunkwania multivorans TaxID=1173618 RepID=A0ABW3CYZ8_9FLAO
MADNVRMAANVGSLFRLADAFGVTKVIFSGIKAVEFNARMRKTARGTEKNIPYACIKDLTRSIADLKEQGYSAIAIEITSSSIPVHRYDFTKHEKIALVLGGENHGVSTSVLQECDSIVHIDMFGKNSSMNVAQAANVCLYEITRQWMDRI